LSGALPQNVSVIAEDVSISGRAVMMQQLRMFGAAQQGIEGDAAIGAAVLAKGCRS
jgi:hypothetical protein